MNINDRIKLLYGKDTPLAFNNLKEMEALSDDADIFYPYIGEFISMLKSESYGVRVRGFRLLCKQAKWDKGNIINAAIGDILLALHDQKPTAVRQFLQYLQHIVLHKKELAGKIEQAVLALDCSAFKDTMQPLIMADITSLLKLFDSYSKVSE